MTMVKHEHKHKIENENNRGQCQKHKSLNITYKILVSYKQICQTEEMDKKVLRQKEIT